MDKKYRLRSNEEFAKVYKNGKNYWNRNLILYIKKNDLGYSRVGFSITKKIGNSVVRNKIKRRMKEVYRINFDNIKRGYDIIFIPKKNIVAIGYWNLEKTMLHILKKSSLLKDKGED